MPTLGIDESATPMRHRGWMADLDRSDRRMEDGDNWLGCGSVPKSRD